MYDKFTLTYFLNISLGIIVTLGGRHICSKRTLNNVTQRPGEVGFTL